MLWLVRLLPLVATVWLCSGCGRSGGDSQPVGRITLERAEFGSLARALGIPEFHGEFELRRPITKLGGRIDVYRDGKKAKSYDCGYVGYAEAREAGTGHYSVHLIDPAVMSLPNVEADRVLFAMQVSYRGGGSVFRTEIPKELFSPEGAVNGAAFPPTAATGEEIPLCYLINYRKQWLMGGTVAEIVAKNAESDLAVLVLEVDWKE